MQNFIAENTKVINFDNFINSSAQNMQSTNEKGRDFAEILGLNKKNTDKNFVEKNNYKNTQNTKNNQSVGQEGKTPLEKENTQNSPGVIKTQDKNTVSGKKTQDREEIKDTNTKQNNNKTVDSVETKPVIKETQEAADDTSTQVLSADEVITDAIEKINNLIENALDGQLNAEDVQALKDTLNQIKDKIDNNEIIVNENTKQELKNILNRLLTQNPQDLEADALIKDFKQLLQDVQASNFKTDSQVKLEEENSNPTRALEVNVETPQMSEKLEKRTTNEEKTTLKTKENQSTIQVSQNTKEVQNADNATDKIDIEQEILDEMDVKIEEVSDSSTNTNSQGQGYTTAQDEVIKLQIQNSDADAPAQTFAFDKSVQNVNALNKQLRVDGVTKELNANDILNQIGSKFEQLKDGVSTKITMTLRPNDLGRVTIELLSNANGITTNIIAQNSQVKELLDKNIDILKQQLAQQGINVQNIQVKTVEQNSQTGLNNSFNNREQNEQNNNNQNQNSNQNNNNSRQRQESYKFNQSNIIENIDFENTSERTTASINTLRGKISYNL